MKVDAIQLLSWAIEDLGGACAVLDPNLVSIEVTAMADALTADALVRGVSIVKALCGDAPQRPIAEALAAGRPASGAIVRPGPDGVMRTLEVRASPIQREGRRVGWLVVLARPDEYGAEADAPVLFHGMWTRDPGMKRIFHVIERAARRDVSVLETQSVIPVGGTEAIEVDVRIVAATHQSLRRAVEHHRFRADLMYRLRVVPIFLPPPVARRGDLELLTDKLIEQLNEEGERRISQVSRAARDAIAGYPWPGNVRELRNTLQYAYVIGDGPILHDVELPPEVSGMAFDPDTTAVNARPPEDAAQDESPEARRIRLALAHSDGNRERAAQILGMSRVTLWRRMKSLGLQQASILAARNAKLHVSPTVGRRTSSENVNLFSHHDRAWRRTHTLPARRRSRAGL